MFSNSSVCILFLFSPVFYIPRKRSAPYGALPFNQTASYDHPAIQQNNIFNDFLTMRNDRDHWRTKYNELK